MNPSRSITLLRHARAAGAVLATILAIAIAPAAWATQHLVNPGEDWQSLGPKIRPGDEIILMPGRHRGATFESLLGTAAKPITIRSADPSKPSEIAATRDAIRVRNAAGLVIRDLVITGGSVGGITLGKPPGAGDGNAPSAPPATSNAEACPVQIRNVRISKIGPRGQRHAIAVMGIDNVQINGCMIEGWGGSAIELVGCRDCTVDHCTLKGLDDHAQANGIRIRGGCARIQVQNCRLVRAGERAISIGGISELTEFQPPISAQAPPGSVSEASSVQVEHCVIQGSDCAIAFVNADDCTARNNTIIRPKRCVFALVPGQADPRFTSGRRNAFGSNLTAWEPGDIQRLAEVGPKSDVETFVLDVNLWWSPDTPEQRQKLGTLPGKNPEEQITTVDPKLDKALKPTVTEAQAYGA